MKDILPPESAGWERLRGIAAGFFSAFGYNLSITPIVEKTELFVRSVGEATDVVSKEMYTFTDRGGDSITLRPEGTASIMRAYMNSPEWKGRVFKTWYWGPMFRYERPQKGRYRQFFQFGLEAIGSDSPYVDAELISMLDLFHKKLGIDDIRVELNTLGCPDCRTAYRKELIGYFKKHTAEICEDCSKRLDINPLRLLDCKNRDCAPVIEKSPVILDLICDNCKSHFETVCGVLKSAGVEYNINSRLVRGLDYYNGTVFEFVTGRLGDRQNAVGGGGRYDSLAGQIDGQAVPAVGYAGGIERLLMLLDGSLNIDEKFSVYIAMLDETTLKKYMPLFIALKKGSIDHKPEYLFNDDSYRVTGAKKHLSKANRINARFAIIAGGIEAEKNEIIIKDLKEAREYKIVIETGDIKKAVLSVFNELDSIVSK
ncbi:MAG: histidine--tRNA ligase [Oligoflexia bacterium]|nr:histidine--tRNA ligase [Oligoflexia bacterium]